MVIFSAKLYTCIALFVVMGSAASSAYLLRPKESSQAKAADFSLELMIPKEFGEWKHDGRPSAAIVNPETKAILDKTYSQIVTRTYLHSSGQRLMLSVAYGNDQRGALQAHKPEVCYPAQGFVLKDLIRAEIDTPLGPINVIRMSTHKSARFEPVTYWFTMGDQRVKSQFDRRLIELKAAATGQIPDGLLFRVSSIDRDSKAAFLVHDSFVNQLLSSASPSARIRLAGLAAVKQ